MLMFMDNIFLNDAAVIFEKAILSSTKLDKDAFVSLKYSFLTFLI